MTNTVHVRFLKRISNGNYGFEEHELSLDATLMVAETGLLSEQQLDDLTALAADLASRVTHLFRDSADETIARAVWTPGERAAADRRERLSRSLASQADVVCQRRQDVRDAEATVTAATDVTLPYEQRRLDGLRTEAMRAEDRLSRLLSQAEGLDVDCSAALDQLHHWESYDPLPF